MWPTPPGHVWGANPPTWPPRLVAPVHPVVPTPVRHLPPVWHLPIGWPVRQPVAWPWGPGRFDHGPVIRHEPTRTTTGTARTARTGVAGTVQAMSRETARGVRPASYPPPDPGAPPRRVPGKPVYKQIIPRNAIVAAARRIEHGQAPHWHDGRYVHYVFGAGHGAHPGPTTIGGRRGVDCSGFTRWVYSLAYHHDVLNRHGHSLTSDQIELLHRDPHRHPGDLVFFGYNKTETAHQHVGVYIGHGMMINAFDDNTVVRTEPITDSAYPVLGFYHGPTVRVRVRGTTPTSASAPGTQRLIDHNPIAARTA